MSVNNSIELESVLYSNYIKYSKLEQLSTEAFSNSPIESATQIHVYIDLCSIVRQLFSNASRLHVTEDVTFTSSILNMVAHYKSFFKRLGVYPIFYLVFSFNSAESTGGKYINNYNKRFKTNLTNNSQLSHVIITNIKLLSLMCKYLQDIYFVYAGDKFNVDIIIADLIFKNDAKNTKIPHIVISKDPAIIQIISLLPNRITMMRPKKSLNEDNSHVYYYWKKDDGTVISNFWETFCREREIKSFDSSVYLDPSFISFLYAFGRLPERDMLSIVPYSKIYNTLSNLIISKQILNSYNNFSIIPLISSCLMESSKSIINDAEIRIRWASIDIPSQHLSFMNTAESKTIELENFHDPDGLQKIINQFFSVHPIDIFNL